MKGAILVTAVAVLVLVVASTGQSRPGCVTAQAQAFASVTGDNRFGGAGGIPGSYSGEKRLFDIRYNCTGKSAQVRRRDVGVYDIRFPGNKGVVSNVTVIDTNGASASSYLFAEGEWRVTMRGPLVTNNVLVPRDLPFYIVIF